MSNLHRLLRLALCLPLAACGSGPTDHVYITFVDAYDLDLTLRGW